MNFHIAVFLLFPLVSTGEMIPSEIDSVPDIPLSNLKVYKNTNEEFSACYRLDSNNSICATSSQKYLRINKGDGEVLFDIRETPEYEFRRIGDLSLIKFKNQNIEKRLLRNNLVFNSTEQVDSYLTDVDQKEFENQAKQLMLNGHVDSLVPLADSIDELDLNKEQQNAVRPILVLALNTLTAENKLKAIGELKMEDSKYLRDRQYRGWKRSSGCSRSPGSPNCLGMCGPGCTCWRFVCGDCCFHKGCYDHDLCCRRSFLSLGCWSPIRLIFNFSCSGYPNCGRG